MKKRFKCYRVIAWCLMLAMLFTDTVPHVLAADLGTESAIETILSTEESASTEESTLETVVEDALASTETESTEETESAATETTTETEVEEEKASAIETESTTETEVEEATESTTETVVGGQKAATYAETANVLTTVYTPVDYASTGTLVDAAIFCSDVHGEENNLTTDTESVFSGIAKSGLTYSTASFVGDTFTDVNGAKSEAVTEVAQSALGNTNLQCFYSYGSHDGGSDIEDYTGLLYSGEYYIYAISQTDMASASNASTEATNFTNKITELDQSKPLFIISHMPLHKRRNDNNGAANWYTAISAAAEKMDITFFWAHNHTGETSVDTNAYYVAKDGSESMTIQGGSTITPNFTYMNAGYINANGQNPSRKGIATTVAIYDDSMVFQDYNSSGAYTGTYAHNVTVAREFAAEPAAPEGIAITTKPTKTQYSLGEELDITGMVVTATYSDGTTAEVTDSDYTVSEVDMSTAGTKSVTVTYQEKTATFDITVVDPATTVNEVVYEDSSTVITATGLGLTEITVADNDDDFDALVADSYVAYDISLEGYTTGNELQMTMMVMDGFYDEDLKLYYVNEDDSLEEIAYTTNTDEEGMVILSFAPTKVGTFVYGIPAVVIPDDAVLTALEVTQVPSTTKYFTTEERPSELPLDITDLEVTATYSNGTDTVSKELVWNEFGEVADGYSLTVDMTLIGKQDVVVTYTYGDVTLTDTYEILICIETVTDEDTSVTVKFEEPSIVEVTITENTANENIQSAVAELLTNYVSYEFDFEGYVEGDNVNVTLPIPEGVTNPGVYHVADDTYATTRIAGIANNGDGTISFTATQFSSYVVGESTEITVPNPTTQTVTGATTTETKDVYVLVSTPTAGNQYIIASSGSAGSAYALKENTTTGSSITINAAGNGISAPYIETSDETIMWNAASGMTFRSENDGYYLRQSQSGGSRSLRFSTSKSTDWTVGKNTLYYEGSQNTYYVSGGSTWSLSNSSANVYFYEKQTVTVTTSANGTYCITGNPAEVSKVVVEGTTTTLGSTLTFVPENGTTKTTDTSTTATYTVVDGGDPNGIISGISGNTVTFTGKYGKALVKVSYTVTVNETNYTVDNYITVIATEPTYTIEITKDDKIVTNVIAVKGVASTTTLQLGKLVTYETANGTDPITPGEGTIEWEILSDQQSIATVDQNGLVTFKGVNGTVNVTVSYKVSDGKYVTDTITITANTALYATPSDGTADFPEYPNEGAVRFDKTATAVGNFSQTGIARVELSMTGVPYTTDNAMDVVVMLDMTGSMSDDGMEAAEEATKAFVKTIVQNEDGSYNSNRVAVYAFNSGSSSPYELVSLTAITSDAELETANTAIDTASDKQASGGTPYDESTKKVYDVLQAAKKDGIGNDRQQFCVFMSDGGPTSYAADDGDGTYTTVTNSGSGNTEITTYLSGYNSSTSSEWEFTLPSEYYTNLMKADGVTVYTVGLLLQTAPSNPSPYSSMKDSTYDSTTDSLTTIGSHYYFCSSILKQMATDESKYIDIFNVDNADDATAKFTAIAAQILEAATNVVVQDKIADDYTMVFDVPTGSKDITGLDNQEFYIEFVSYTLNADHERVDGGETSLLKIYLGTKNGTYFAASDSSGTAYVSPVFTEVSEGEKGYYAIVDSTYAVQAGEIVINVNGTYYKFITDGSGDYNMTSGAYAYGTIDSTINMSTDLVIVTPYFCYSAATRMLAWTTNKLTTTEYALRYFLYLDNSATEIGTDNEVAPASYETNDYATITYTNFNGIDCQQYFPVPQMTWNGAQVSYVFYLVNAQGQPINKSGQVVDFANATFVTDVFTESVVWNEEGEEGTSELKVNWLADDLLPDSYDIYDEAAKYEIHVYQTHEGDTINDYFIISGSGFNVVNPVNGNTVLSTETTKVYNTKAGIKYSEYGTYYSTDYTGIDFANTTVAFAVVWEPKLVEDTVVVDYGLPVIINVVQNDFMQNTVSGIGLSKEAYGTVEMNTGVSTTSKLGTAALTTADGSTISIENENSVRFTQKDMTFTKPTVFYYETPVEYYEGSNKKEGFMYSSVTVVPATTIYYEDTDVFVEYKDGTFDANNVNGKWTVAGNENNSATQDSDRPGESQISASLDKDNIYGYDSAYLTSSTYSLGSAHKVTVSAMTNTSGSWPTAKFTFTGTAFDLISLTSNATGTITVNVDGTGGNDYNWFVDTYYGYTYTENTVNPYIKYTFVYGTDGKWHVSATEEVKEPVATEGESTEVPANPEAGDQFVSFEDNGIWTVTDSAADNALYQIPVIKSPEMDYDTYTVTITPRYANAFNHVGDDAYDFYVDAIRIYNPAKESDAANDVYVQDGEAYPEFIEIRSSLLGQDAFDTTEDSVAGAVFIDGFGTSGDIDDYEAYGPNNEVYLQKGQSVAFKLTSGSVDSVHIGLKAPNGGDAAISLNGQKIETSSATELYYDISEYVTWSETGVSNVLVITNENDAMVSLTNIKITHKTTTETAAALMMSYDDTLEAVSYVSARYLASLPVEEPEEPEVFVPETFEVKLNKTNVMTGEIIMVTVTTSSDVAKVTVGGEELTNSYLNKRTGLTTWTYTVMASEEGEMVLDVVACDSNELASEPVVNTVTVEAISWNGIKNWLSGLFGRFSR